MDYYFILIISLFQYGKSELFLIKFRLKDNFIKRFFYSHMGNDVLSDKKAQDLYKMIYSLKPMNRIKVGFNSAIKAINNGCSLLVVIAKDTVPSCLVDPLPILCEQKGAQYVFVDSKIALGKACGLEISVMACSIITDPKKDSTNILKEISHFIN